MRLHHPVHLLLALLLLLLLLLPPLLLHLLHQLLLLLVRLPFLPRRHPPLHLLRLLPCSIKSVRRWRHVLRLRPVRRRPREPRRLARRRCHQHVTL